MSNGLKVRRSITETVVAGDLYAVLECDGDGRPLTVGAVTGATLGMKAEDIERIAAIIRERRHAATGGTYREDVCAIHGYWTSHGPDFPVTCPKCRASRTTETAEECAARIIT